MLYQKRFHVQVHPSTLGGKEATFVVIKEDNYTKQIQIFISILYKFKSAYKLIT